MTKGSNGYDQSSSKAVATTGYGYSVPVNPTVSFKASGGGEASYQNKSQVSYGDKQTGCYGRETVTQKVTAGEFEWKNGTTGTRNEYTQKSTVRVGDKSGYREVYKEERVRDVTYDRSGCNNNNKNYVTYGNGYGNGNGGLYGGGGHDDESDDDGRYGDCGDDEDTEGEEDGLDGDFGDEDGSFEGSDYGEEDDGGSDGDYGYDSDY